MATCFFVSDLHGRVGRYRKLFDAITAERPDVVFLGGDLLPSAFAPAISRQERDFLHGFVGAELARLKSLLRDEYPQVLAIMGNDDPRTEEPAILDLAERGLWEYIHNRRVNVEGHEVYGYCCVPPTPFGLKDWERYDVSRYIDPGCIAPEDGVHTVALDELEEQHRTIKEDLESLIGEADLGGAVFLFHAPPHQTNLDRAALDGKMVDHAPVDVHVGSIAIRRMIEAKQPMLTLHGHIHESARIRNSWRDQIGKTICCSAAHCGQELALVRFNMEMPDAATRELL